MNKLVDLNVWILKWHFAAYFLIRNYLLKQFRPLGLFFKYVYGTVFVAHNFIVNLLLELKFGDYVKYLVTDRLHHYKKLPKKDARKKWADELGAFTNKYDPGHY